MTTHVHASEPDRPAPHLGRMFRVGYWWLVVASVLCIGWGLAMAVTPDNPMLREWTDGVATTFYEGNEPPAAGEFRRFMLGMLGAALVGFYLLQLGILIFGLRTGQAWAWWTTALATGFALTLDTTMSLVHGAGFNVWFNNLPPAIGFGIPLILTAPAIFRSRRSAR